MTTKNYATYIQRQCKGIDNISLEQIFENYIIEKNGKRIGVLWNNGFYLYSTINLKKMLPNAIEINPFNWAYYRLIHIDDTENPELLKKLVDAVYNDLYFWKEHVCNISDLIQAYRSYSDIVVKTYDLHVTFLRFCYEKKIIKINPLEKNNRIIRMNYINNDLTEEGTKVFPELYEKWLVYTDKNDEKTSGRIVNTKILEKYYSNILKNLR